MKTKKVKNPEVKLQAGTTVLVFGNGPDDRYYLDCAMKGKDMIGILFNLDQWLRGKLKHGHQFQTPDEALEACRTYLSDCVNDEDLWHLINQ